MDEAKIHIGTSGFSYNHWRGVFYPKETPKKDWLSYYSKFFSTIELNVTFYRLPNKEVFTGWYNDTPKDYIFSIKGPRIITHYKKLKNIKEPLNNFFYAIASLKEKLRVILWQFPPGLKKDEKAFTEFCYLLKKYKFKYAFEFRDLSWFENKVYQAISQINGTVVRADWPYNLSNDRCTSKVFLPKIGDFIYIRKHGAKILYQSLYSPEDLSREAVFIENFLLRGQECFVYFNNDANGNAAKNALQLKKLIADRSVIQR